ncbi:hypothetical protein [Stenotrophomonas rhizophila]|jgi:hypothetical protein|uniref:hypothetical protein n=1 Tax=Stenotrophomonas rhizophila TaxID=216778 RepID=UPI0010C0A39A|nr:hypothetical protein [Stenotrophomonas rhizophila]MDY0954301.1 hypothetical protein [Stenotrophomonas rhizophila]TKK03065.1 hypothetical protein SrhCFBP13529_19375 [Stenotrophomonas rhizophila]
MNIARWTHGVLLMALLGALPAHAEEGRPGKGLSEIPDPELNLMRGRYTVNGSSVAWFGVTMISQWTSGGQAATSALTVGMDFRAGGAPKVSFTPSVTVTAADAPLPVFTGRSIDASGLQNVAGLTQSIQVAGDGNVAGNTTHLTVRDGDAPAPAAQGQHLASVQQGGVSAVAQLDGNNARVQLQIEGVGAVQQWIRSGSVGQSIALGSDGQTVSNRMQIDLVRQSLASNVPLSQNVAQAMTLVRGVGMGPGQ